VVLQLSEANHTHRYTRKPEDKQGRHNNLRSQAMARHQKRVIVFLSASWSNIADRIRQGEKPGGTPSVVRIWQSCSANGFDTHVFIMSEHERGGPSETVWLDGVHFHWIREPFKSVADWLRRKDLIGLCKPLWLVWQLQIIYHVIKSKIRPDIIYCMRPTYLVSGWLLSRLSGAKLVWRQYGCSNVYEPWFLEKSVLRRLKNLGTFLAHRIPVDLLIATNDGTRGDEIAKWAGFPMKRHRYWFNGVDKSLRVPAFDAVAFKQSLGLSADSLIILMLGRLCHFKRPYLVINAMPEILKEVPNARLVLVGGGELRSELEDLVSTRGLTGKVLLVGPVPHEEIWKHLNAADLFVIVNICSNLSSTLIEAMAAGCCILTADIGGTTQVAINDVNSLVLDEANPSSIARGAIQLLKDPQRRRRLGEAAFQYAMEKFQTWDDRMQMEVDELEKLLYDR